MGSLRASLAARLDARRESSSGIDTCWPHVRGSIRITVSGNQSTELRRAAWLVAYGVLPPRYRHLEILCGNPKCLNPRHMSMFTETERFWRQVDKSGGPNACWPWTGIKLRGYGRFQRGDHAWNKKFAHRVAFDLFHGVTTKGDNLSCVIMHTCDNPPCCNPRHLRLGTAKDNSQDAVRKGRHAHGARLSVAVRAAHARKKQRQDCASRPESEGREPK